MYSRCNSAYSCCILGFWRPSVPYPGNETDTQIWWPCRSSPHQRDPILEKGKGKDRRFSLGFNFRWCFVVELIGLVGPMPITHYHGMIATNFVTLQAFSIDKTILTQDPPRQKLKSSSQKIHSQSHLLWCPQFSSLREGKNIMDADDRVQYIQKYSK